MKSYDINRKEQSNMNNEAFLNNDEIKKKLMVEAKYF